MVHTSADAGAMVVETVNCWHAINIYFTIALRVAPGGSSRWYRRFRGKYRKPKTTDFLSLVFLPSSPFKR
jgi:hypothetical protein